MKRAILEKEVKLEEDLQRILEAWEIKQEKHKEIFDAQIESNSEVIGKIYSSETTLV